MKAVIYARYSSDNQREESIEGQNPGVYRLCREERYYHPAPLHRPGFFRQDRQSPGISKHD